MGKTRSAAFSGVGVADCDRFVRTGAPYERRFDLSATTERASKRAVGLSISRRSRTGHEAVAERRLMPLVISSALGNGVSISPLTRYEDSRRDIWKTWALGAGIEERLRDAITGHSVASVGRRYETPTLRIMADAIRRFPPYSRQRACEEHENYTSSQSHHSRCY